MLAARSGRGGKCFAFEPHPATFAWLQANIRNGFAGRNDDFADVSLFQTAVGSGDGYADLIEPEGFSHEEGSARLASGQADMAGPTTAHRVVLKSLDSVFTQGERFGVMKIDVEGAELGVLHGAQGLFADRRIRDVVYEDFQPFPSNCAKFLAKYDYKIYRIAKTVFRPVIWDPSNQEMQRYSLPWEPINYIATLDAARVESRLRGRGWQCLAGRR